MNEKALPVIMNRSSASGHFACRIGDLKRDTNLRIRLASRIYLDACDCDLKFAHPVTRIARANQYRSKTS
jgi:hypothetical protein